MNLLKSLEYRAFVVGPQTDLYLGRLYEARRDVEKARLHYARLVRVWEDCDPELRPMWEEGRRALVRLTREETSR